MSIALAREAVRCCRSLAQYSEAPVGTTRTFLSPPMRDVHARLTAWMHRLGMPVTVDAAGNLRGVYAASPAAAPARRLFIGSHLDTVPNAGAFDGVLGVVLGIALVELLDGRRLPFAIEVVGFSEEEGVRYGVPFIGSRALAGTIDEALLDRCDAGGRTVRDAIRAYGLDPARLGDARAQDDAMGYLELHIEQGPQLQSLGLSVGIVDAIAGQSRLEVTFTGVAAHAGTTPMRGRRDALAAAAEWTVAVEHEAAGIPGLVATVGSLDAEPGVPNVVAGRCRANLDVRHSDDRQRSDAVERLVACARAIGQRRGLEVAWQPRLDQPAVAMDPGLVNVLVRSADRGGFPVHCMGSGAGHDAMIVAGRMPAAMLLIASPRGISHHPDEAVVEEDVAAALVVARHALDEIARSQA